MNAPQVRPIWQPGATLATARVRASMLANARRFFAAHDILEVDTPALSRAAVSDPNIESVGARLAADPAHHYYLHTSPEFAMKRLLCAGWPDIYQVCKVFRDGEVGRRHQPEFTMIEWYRRDLSLQQMISHTTDFILELLTQADRTYRVVSMSYREAFLHYLQLDPLSASIADLRQAAVVDAPLAETLGEQRDQWLDLLLSTKLAPQFDAETLLVLHHYPASQAALARLCPDDPRVADRFEIFCGDLELANGYYELGDPDEQLLRCQQDQRQRQSRAAPLRPLDEDFLAALRAGLPPCCGVAIGFDRLVMLHQQTDRLDDVQLFTTVNPNHG